MLFRRDCFTKQQTLYVCIVYIISGARFIYDLIFSFRRCFQLCKFVFMSRKWDCFIKQLKNISTLSENYPQTILPFTFDFHPSSVDDDTALEFRLKFETDRFDSHSFVFPFYPWISFRYFV